MSDGFHRMPPGGQVDAAELHNRIAGRVVIEIVRPIIANGGTPEDIMVLMESVAAGVLLALRQLSATELGDADLVDLLATNVKRRLVELRAERQRAVN